MSTRTGIALTLVVLALPAPAHAKNAEGASSRRWVIVVDGGHRAGEQVVDCRGDGHCSARYVFKDNGRGPEIAERFRLAPDGSFAEYRATGTSTFGSRVDERYALQGGVGRWRSTTERGESVGAGGRLYLPLNGSSVVFELMLRMTAGGARPLGLLPAGEVTRRTLGTLEVGSGAQRRNLELVAFSGLGLTPVMGWATAGPVPELFGYVEPGYMAMVPEGFEADVARLTAAQVAADHAVHHTALGDRGDEALGNDVVAQEVREVGAVEHKRAVADGHVCIGAGFAHAKDRLVVEGGGGEGWDSRGSKVGCGDLGEDVGEDILGELFDRALEQGFEHVQGGFGILPRGDMDRLKLVAV